MAHVRKQIRDRVESILKSGVTLAQRRVYASRIYPLTGPDLPAVAVYTASEGSALQTMGTRTLARDI